MEPKQRLIALNKLFFYLTQMTERFLQLVQKKYIKPIVDITLFVRKADLNRNKIQCFSYITLFHMFSLSPGLIYVTNNNSCVRSQMLANKVFTHMSQQNSKVNSSLSHGFM